MGHIEFIAWFMGGVAVGFFAGASVGYSMGLDDVRVGPSAWKRLKAWLAEPF